MSCPACGSAVIECSIPDPVSSIQRSVDAGSSKTAETPAAIAICTHCLTVAPTDEPDEEPDFSCVSDGFPARSEPAVALALAMEQCCSLARNRESIAELLEYVERTGVDPLLAIDRLLADPTIEPDIDLDRRRQQLEQLLY